jgi:hypothetical protein
MGDPKGASINPQREFYILLRLCYFYVLSVRDFITIWLG